MKKLEKNVTAIVVGNGSFAKELTRQIMTTEFNHSSIIIVSIANYGKSMLPSSLYKQSSLPIYKDLQAISTANSIIFAFDKSETEDVMSKLGNVNFKNEKHYQIISFVPELLSEKINNQIPCGVNRTIIQSYCNGSFSNPSSSIASDTYSPLLERLGHLSVWPAYSI